VEYLDNAMGTFFLLAWTPDGVRLDEADSIACSNLEPWKKGLKLP
jgi:hypothetical protein